MKVLFIGDVVGQKAAAKLGKALPGIKLSEGTELVIINGENSSDGNGITPHSAKMLFDMGADVITTGNHAFKRKEMDAAFEERRNVLRPANFGDDCPGAGVFTVDFGYCALTVINLMGATYMPPCDNPFKCADALLRKSGAKNIIVDFHAEATAEKKAMGRFLRGRVSAVLGTHTHVQTADERIVGGTAYITDVGMTGASDSIIGAEKNMVEKFIRYYPQKYFPAEGECEVNAVTVEIDVSSGRAVSIKRIAQNI
ncbi:MAG: YmdB family metallophosphoesterase [Oscillospiraceae bacterium]|jgi:metallophosphoesterase (TIGR00282 family)|nr:YmdB family metallophosphoesterase [Oscillospiraceae bacterium]